MAKRESAGLLLFRQTHGRIDFLLAHPGGPHWKGRHKGAWTVPKGGINPGEQPLAAAIREFREETGFEPEGPYLPLGSITQRGGKIVHAWAFEGDCDPSTLVSVMAMTEWPVHSGTRVEIPEIDRAEFFEYDAASVAINTAQIELLDRLSAILAAKDAT